MKYRKRLSKHVSKRHFRKNTGTRGLNYSKSVMRGGIRL